MESEVLVGAPQILVEAVAGCIWQPILTGLSTAQVFRLEQQTGGKLYLKIAPQERAGFGLFAEKQNLDWLSGKLPVPEVRLFAANDSLEYLLTSEIAGHAASEDSLKTHMTQVVEQLVVGLKLIQSLVIDDCEFDMRLDRTIREAWRSVEMGLVDESDFDDERIGRSAEDLFQELVAIKPKNEDLVFTHGDYCLPNVILQDLQLGGFVDWARAGIADPYRDIALLARSVKFNFGAEWLPLLFESLGIEPDHDKLHFYQLLDEFF
jgi:aminoglycoside phosphotransferase